MLVCYNIPLTEDASPPPPPLNLDHPPPFLVTRLGAVGAVATAPVVPAVAPATVPTLQQ